ncbi:MULTISPECIES: hypothetical protein [Bacteria]|uniref:hypothetical protein n=1 Tax=Bacteria TaxID=2 RepID=UPI0015F0ACE0|nr:MULTISPECIES: hypothetical protein [Bacteria]MBH0013697.1 hypothetical protein [Pseudoalteromonas sp. NZS100_1]MBH0040781.1 hypothetical protein [Pseudoalteromonas sp. SWN166]MBH0052520.1 hypothetical protein [Pseudoalteromonas sp. SWYJZ19]MBQ1204118.1 hypothetical protein [Loktanella sp.]
MKKADYAALAAVLQDRIAEARARGWVQAESELRLVACELARTLNVNRAEFLKACGIEP